MGSPSASEKRLNVRSAWYMPSSLMTVTPFSLAVVRPGLPGTSACAAPVPAVKGES